MKLSTIATLGSGLFLALALSATPSKAAAVNGSINFDGEATTNTGSLATATAFSSITGTFVDPGTQTGTFASVPDYTTVSFTPFSFSAGGVTPLWTFTIGNVTYSFDATSIVVETQNSTFLNIEGSGVAYVTGDTAAVGHWSITDTGNGPNFTFGEGTSVPDSGATAALLALGVVALGAAVYARRGMALEV